MEITDKIDFYFQNHIFQKQDNLIQGHYLIYINYCIDFMS